MKFIDLVKKRQSVRKFLPKPVPRETLDRCLEAARLAPSACNSQPWAFIVIDDEKLKNKIVDEAFSGIYALNTFNKTAPCLVVVVTERSRYTACLGGYLRSVQYSLVDIGIAGEHFVLQAAEEGLGTCWLGWFDEKAVKNILALPKDKKVDVIISVGYPADETVRPKIRKPLDETRSFR